MESLIIALMPKQKDKRTDTKGDEYDRFLERKEQRQRARDRAMEKEKARERTEQQREEERDQALERRRRQRARELEERKREREEQEERRRERAERAYEKRRGDNRDISFILRTVIFGLPARIADESTTVGTSGQKPTRPVASVAVESAATGSPLQSYPSHQGISNTGVLAQGAPRHAGPPEAALRTQGAQIHGKQAVLNVQPLGVRQTPVEYPPRAPVVAAVPAQAKVASRPVVSPPLARPLVTNAPVTSLPITTPPSASAPLPRVVRNSPPATLPQSATVPNAKEAAKQPVSQTFTRKFFQSGPTRRPASMLSTPRKALPTSVSTATAKAPSPALSPSTHLTTAFAQEATTSPTVVDDYPEVDIVIHNLHVDGHGTSRAFRRLPVAVLLAHMMGVIAHRGLLLHSVAATVHSITIVLEDGTIGKHKMGRSSGFSTFVDEMVNLPKEAWAGSGGSGSGERNEHIRSEGSDLASNEDKGCESYEKDHTLEEKM